MAYPFHTFLKDMFYVYQLYFTKNKIIQRWIRTYLFEVDSFFDYSSFFLLLPFH